MAATFVATHGQQETPILSSSQPSSGSAPPKEYYSLSTDDQHKANSRAIRTSQGQSRMPEPGQSQSQGLWGIREYESGGAASEECLPIANISGQKGIGSRVKLNIRRSRDPFGVPRPFGSNRARNKAQCPTSWMASQPVYRRGK